MACFIKFYAHSLKNSCNLLCVSLGDINIEML